MTEEEIHLKLSEVVIDNDNLDYIKLTGEICGKLRWDLVKLFAIPDVSGSFTGKCGCCGKPHNFSLKTCQECDNEL
jgi:hypothetical protein